MAPCERRDTVAVTEDGELLAWGDGKHGHLGLGAPDDDARSRKHRLRHPRQPPLRLLAAETQPPVKALAAGVDRPVLRHHRRVEPDRPGGCAVYQNAPALVGRKPHAVVTEAGELWAYGRGAQGRLGLNDGQDRLVPTRVDPQHFAHAPICAVAAGASHSAAVSAGGAWGNPAPLDPRKHRNLLLFITAVPNTKLCAWGGG